MFTFKQCIALYSLPTKIGLQFKPDLPREQRTAFSSVPEAQSCTPLHRAVLGTQGGPVADAGF